MRAGTSAPARRSMPAWSAARAASSRGSARAGSRSSGPPPASPRAGGSRGRLSVGAHRPIAPVAGFDELVGGQPAEALELADDDRAEPPGGLDGIGVGAPAGVGDHEVGEAEGPVVLRPHLHW